MHFMWMAHRLVSSKSPTRYASAASCRVKMAHTWKHILYLPTSRAISWTRYEQGNLQMRRSALFWNWQILQRTTITGWYLWGFFTLLAWGNSFWGALPPTVSWSFLLTGYSPPNIDVPASTAIWANCQVGDDPSDLPTSFNFSDIALLLSISLRVGGTSMSGAGGSACVWGSGLACTSAVVLTFLVFPLSLFPGVIFVLAILEKSQPIRSLSSLTRVRWHFFKLMSTFQNKIFSCLFCHVLYHKWQRNGTGMWQFQRGKTGSSGELCRKR